MNKGLIASVGYFNLSIDSILFSYFFVACLSIGGIWLTRMKIFFPSLIIKVNGPKNMYINSVGQICVSNELDKNSVFKFQVNQIKEGNYEYRYLGFIPWRKLKKIKHQNQKNVPFKLLKEKGKTYCIKIRNFINKYKSPLGLTENVFFIVFEYKEDKTKKTNYLVESILLINESSEQKSSSIQGEEDSSYIIWNNWLLSQMIIPFVYLAGLSFFITAIYLTFHNWLEFKLLQLPELQICLDLKDSSESNTVYRFIIIGFICIYAGLLLRYVLQMISLKDGLTREQEYHNCILKFIEGVLLVLPVLLLQGQPLTFASDGYLQLNSNLILSIWIIVVWLLFNIIKGVSLLKRWIIKDKDSGEKYPRTYLLLAIITFLVGLLFRGK